MSYRLQSMWGRDNPNAEWNDSKAWRQPFDNLERAVNALKHDANLSRVVCRLRVIDDSGVTYATYEPDDDMRLPGCRWEATRKAAQKLWEAAGSPLGRDMEFWLRAESELPDSIGVTIVA